MQHETVLKPIGVIRSRQTELAGGAASRDDSWARALWQRAATAAATRIEIDPAPDGILDGTEDYSHLLVQWWPDWTEPRRTGGLKALPTVRQDLPEVGIFATRSPRGP